MLKKSKMKIFIPSSKDANPYLDEILNYTKNEFIFGNYKNYKFEYDIVNIQWPESIFGWKEPTANNLEDLEREIKRWKISSKLIYTFHDERSHFGMTPNYLKLFDLIETNADAFIHLGEYSKKKMERIYPNATHQVIFHPTYEGSFSVKKKAEARKAVEIDPNALVILAPGRIRSVKERKMILKAFKSLPQKNKVLISNYMLPFHFQNDFKGRIKLKKIFDINKFKTKRMREKFIPPKYIFNFGFTDFDEFSKLISAADLLIVPRLDTLNSGNVFLGLSYRKIVVGPAIGNIKETLQEFNFPIFDPSSLKSIKEALKQGVQKFKKGEILINEEVISKYHPRKIAEEMDDFFEK